MKGTIQKRFERIGSLSKLAFDIGYMTHVKKASPKMMGTYTKNKLATMGPTFIKIGQFISTREDIFGKEFVDELKGLQDKIDPFVVDIEEIQRQNDIHIDETPIATASIGQVYRGSLSSGENIVIKVKRPCIEETIQSDFDAFLFVLNIVKLVSNQREAMELSIVINEYYTLLQEEVNFTKEVENMQSFKRLFSNKQYVKIPTVYDEKSNNSIIVMEYVPSLRIDDIEGIRRRGMSPTKIAEKLMELFLDQILLNGIVHIDPHPGNVGITQEGKIVFYDYGMIQKIGIDFKNDLKNILLAVYDKNIDFLCELLISSEIVIIEKSMTPYLRNFVLVFLSYIDTLNVDSFKENYIDKIDNTELPFKLSSKFLLILRGLSILEGVCKSLDPDFNYRYIIEKYVDSDIADIKYIEQRAMRDISNVRDIPNRVTQNEIQIEILEKNIQKIRSAPNTDKIYTFAMIFLLFDMIDNMYIRVGLFCATFIVLYK